MLSGNKIQFDLKSLSELKYDQRIKQHIPSARYKGRGLTEEKIVHASVGDIVYLLQDRDKTRSRPRYIISEILDQGFCRVYKFTTNQLRGKAYRVRLSDLIKVPVLDQVQGSHEPSNNNTPGSTPEGWATVDENTPGGGEIPRKYKVSKGGGTTNGNIHEGWRRPTCHNPRVGGETHGNIPAKGIVNDRDIPGGRETLIDNTPENNINKDAPGGKEGPIGNNVENDDPDYDNVENDDPDYDNVENDDPDYANVENDDLDFDIAKDGNIIHDSSDNGLSDNGLIDDNPEYDHAGHENGTESGKDRDALTGRRPSRSRRPPNYLQDYLLGDD